MKNFLLTLILFLALSCSKEPEYIDVEPLTTLTDSERTAGYSQTNNAYFGDLHIHTSWSFDAFIFNVRTSPDDAYRYGKGEAIPHVSGDSIQMERPLDFMAVTDHAEYMGIMMQMQDQENPLAQLKIAKQVNDPDPKVSRSAFNKIGMSLAMSWPYKKLIKKDIIQNTWERIVEAADRHYVPGKFTTFAGYEWTSAPAELFAWPQYARNMHRNVIFKGGKVSGIPFSSFDSQDPEHLWDWMEKERAKGIEVMAIPHNANMSDGMMYSLETMSGKALTADYAKRRARNEPINEVVQIKGQSMVHPELAPNDEFADFEVYAYTFSQKSPPPPSQVQNSYVREALKNGLSLEESLGENPFKFGLIGSSDGHNAASAIEENNYPGKIGNVDATPAIRLDEKLAKRPRLFSAAGLAGVWAKENTREAIFEALERKETFATSGPRIKVRFFAGWNLEVDSLSGNTWLDQAYTDGVPMGSDLRGSEAGNQSPSFLIWALKDTEGANLDRVQVIKGYLDKDGNPQEKIFDVAWAGDRAINANGKLPSIGSTVDMKTATYTNNIGAISLQTIWTDPGFNPEIKAFYYLRVLEIPTPRWSTYDAIRAGLPLPKDVSATIQERAWSSPIWYHPTD